MNARSIHGTSPEAITAALERHLADGFEPTLAIVFLAKEMDYRAVCSLFDTHGIRVFGASTNGEFIDETTHNGTCAVLLLDVKPDAFRIVFEDFEEKRYRETAQKATRKVMASFKNPAFLLSCSDSFVDAEAVLFGMADIVGPDINAFGNVAGDNTTFTGSYVFTNDRCSEEGMLLLAFDGDRIDVKGRAVCGWHAVGTVRTVTKSEGNHVYTVDDIPVLDLTAKYGGIENVNPENEKLFFEIAATLPLQLQREQGDPVMRPGLRIDWTDRSYYCSGSVPKGSKVRFSIPPDFDVAEKVIQSAQDLHDTEMPEADAVVLFSCVGRYLSFGPMINQEIEGVKNVWNAPMAGMFSNAELGRTKGGNLEMHNLTAVVIAIKEK